MVIYRGVGDGYIKGDGFLCNSKNIVAQREAGTMPIPVLELYFQYVSPNFTTQVLNTMSMASMRASVWGFERSEDWFLRYLLISWMAGPVAMLVYIDVALAVDISSLGGRLISLRSVLRVQEFLK